ncbi:hypothetical protein H8959_015842, partial [Pygathrix nigripes]
LEMSTNSSTLPVPDREGYRQGTLTLYFFLLSGEANMHNIIKLVSEDVGLWGLKEHNIYSSKAL